MAKKALKIFSVLLAVVVGAPLVAAVIFMLRFDPNAYRTDIAAALTEQIGRQVKLSGPIELGFSFDQGFKLGIQDVSVANPSWASRPDMAKVGSLGLGVAWRPLLRSVIDVSSLKISGADIIVETNAAGQSNWEMGKTAAAPAQQAPSKEAESTTGKQPVFHVNGVAVRDSKITVRDKTGKASVATITSLNFVPKGKGMELDFSGDFNGMPVTLDLTSEEPLESVMKVKWPFEANVRYASLGANIKGILDASAKKLIDSYALNSGDSTITGKMEIDYGGVRPVINGTLTSERLSPSDFKLDTGKEAEGVEPAAQPMPAKETTEGQKYVFSREPFDLSGLKAADARLEVKIGELKAGPSVIHDVQTKLDLMNGRLLLSPFKAKVGDKFIEGQIKVDAASKPVQVLTLLKAYQIDLSKLVSLGGFSSFIESKGDVDMDITASGNSPHELASSANGQINMVMAGGSVSSQGAGEIASDLLNVFAPGTGAIAKPGLNCLVAHLRFNNGQLETQGLLMDTAQVTIMGTGGANLRDETVDMLLHSRTKLVDVGAFTPPLRISGALAKPSYKPDAAASIDKVKGLIQGGALTSGVPEMIQQSGQNDCEYTLKHGKPAQPAQAPATVQEAVGKAQEKVKDIGGKLLDGIFGK